MQSRADKLLEGFKLGSLGAGTKKFVEPDDRGSIELIKQGFNTLFKKDDSPFVYWKDPDGWTYYLIIEAFDKRYDKYSISLYGGLKLEPFKNPSSGWTIKNSDWGAEVGFSSGYKKRVSEFDSLVSSIKRSGVKALISQDIVSQLQPYGGSRPNFSKWLESKGIES